MEVEGVTDPGGFSTMVLPSQIRRVGHAELPAPQAATAQMLMETRLEAQRVVIEGVVSSFQVLPGTIRMKLILPDGFVATNLFDRFREAVVATCGRLSLR